MDTDIITSGNHINKTFAEVFNNDPSYCKFIMSKSNLRAPSLIKFKTYLLAKEKTEKQLFVDEPINDELLATTVFTTGRYNGKSFEFVVKRDKSYCRWILDNTTKNPIFDRFKRYLNNINFEC